MQNNRQLEILGILIVSISVFILISLLGYHLNEEPTISSNIQIENPMGILGIYISHYLIKLTFGFATIIIPIIGFFWGWFLFSKRKLEELKHGAFYGFSVMLILSITIGTIEIATSNEGEISYIGSGLIGGNIAQLFVDWLSIWGAFLFLLSGFLIILRAYFDFDYHKFFIGFQNKWEIWIKKNQFKKDLKKKENLKIRHKRGLKEKLDSKRKKEYKNILNVDLDNNKSNIEENSNALKHHEDKKNLDIENVDSSNVKLQKAKDVNKNSQNKLNNQIDSEASEANLDNDLNIEDMDQNEDVDLDLLSERQKPKREYVLPSSDLLKKPLEISDDLNRDELIERANYLTESLSTYGVQGKVVNVHPGPVITLFEIEPAEGVRVNKFVQLSDDLARVMEASSVRVIAPIPGKSSVGIEIPNRNPAIVFFKSVINSSEFAETKSMLTLAIGKNTTGGISTLDLAKMPHLLIAGTTGSGKSVCINTIICSILYRATPEEVKFVMIDPKKVEMTLYRKLEGYHLLKMEDISEPIVTSVDNAILSLRALEKEMDRRYTTLADVLVRNISEYNEKMLSQGNPILPYIVLIVDELADLMMLSAKDVEAPIARLAQLARAVGIHLVIATQRPSVDVITGVIKANFPSRIAFQVASKIDSRTIIDQPGADKLIGRGDMLHLGTGSSDVFRMHNAFLSLEEIEALMNHITIQPKPDEIILPSIRESQLSEFNNENTGSDEFFNDAIALVITHQQGSISLLQRRLKIGYSRAARLIDEMERVGVVGPFTGSKAREVLVDETYLEMIKD